MDAKRIRTWLLANPRPAKVKVLSGTDGESRIVEISPGVPWTTLAESVHALDPELIEALDGEGNTLRSVKPEEEPEPPPPEQISIPQGVDGGTQQLLVFAQLLAGAYRHSTDVAFERMVSMFEACNRRSETLENSLDSMVKLLRRAVQDSVDAQLSAAAGGGGEEGLGGLIRAFIEGKMQGELEKVTNGVTNGKADK